MQNLAQYTKRRASIEKRADGKQQAANAAVFDSSLGAYSNLRGNDGGESSVLNQSIDASDEGRNDRERFGDNRRMRTNMSQHLNYIKMKNDSAIDSLSNIQYLIRD